jgi:O-antigen/teichoic acid export membrane protein
MLLPIVTSPILSRRLGAELLGIYNYVDAIVSIFLVFASTGIYRYGMREIAKYKENKDLMSQKYINIVLVNILNVFFVISIYFLFVIYMVDETNRMYFWIKLVTLLTVIFDNAFLYYGLENIKILTLRDGLTKIVAFVCIVIFIKSSEDIYLYFIIMSICPFISAFWGFIYSRRFIKFKIPELKECKKLYKPLICR